ncbi:Uncharacterised protein [Salmonella enterica subsp. enterica serovar Bovismorbificans]|uniref:Uncharacterized protein n=2 Tax=Salmonella enterica subsp. enterica serovar Bovismorbificans TaxID=58097 RepID=A0A655BU88_SALET|nr:Uncharacterised protein [Salmonella enterica subsp. enterica serovar Bovismorbificans]CNT78505.1 Uncharacterised protein [Salmonella enterica subsp. enterica serovar Bovismorbificans]CQB63522.1 Uncharacterised protein [Salmonella enterica subsp. enterica serovar Bovismorbificans]
MPLFQFRQLRRFGDGVVKVAETVHQTIGFRVFSGPDMALRDFINLLRRTLTRVCHQRDKAFVAVLNTELHHLLHFR